MNKFVVFICICFSFNISFAQNWMTNLEVAQRLALTQNKLLVVIWEDAYYKQMPIYLNDGQGGKMLVKNMFSMSEIDRLLWEHFIPVVLSENQYPQLYNTIKNSRSATYLAKFNDDSLKVMDVNGNILNIHEDEYILNLSEFINKYGIDVSFLNTEYLNYKREKNFYSTFYLASKYMDLAFFIHPEVRSDMIDLASVYLDEASVLLEKENFENIAALEQRVSLLHIQEHLIMEKPKKVLRQLKRINESEIDKVNINLVSFLYFSAYRMLQDEENAALWRGQISILDMKKIMSLINKTPS